MKVFRFHANKNMITLAAVVTVVEFKGLNPDRLSWACLSLIYILSQQCVLFTNAKSMLQHMKKFNA